MVDAPLILFHQGGEGPLVPLPGLLYQRLFLGHAFLTSLPPPCAGGQSLKSRCMPAVMRSMSSRVEILLICSL